jgi:Fe-Mn family superoxide dismutase
MPITLPELPYPHDALEPHLDARTMEIHHSKHHKAYVDGFNEVAQAMEEAREKGDKRAIPALESKLAFHLGGHVNHTLYWSSMAAPGQGGGGAPVGPLAQALQRDFGSWEKFQAQFHAAALGVEGNGWAWLIYQPILSRLVVVSVMNHENQVVLGSVPILGVDVWEHAYYLKYQNRRADFLTAWWNVANWPEAARRFAAASGMLQHGVPAVGEPGERPTGHLHR